MASINGIFVKGLNTFYGHEGELLCQGNVYLGQKKICFWSQDSHGGPDHFTFESQYSEQLLNQSVSRRNPDKAIHGGSADAPFVIDYDLSMLLFDYVKLEEHEKAFKEAAQEGYTGILVLTDGYHEIIWSLPDSYTKMADDALLTALKPDLETARQTLWKETESKKHSIAIYRSLDDFVVGECIPLSEITPKKSLDRLLADSGQVPELHSHNSQFISEDRKDCDPER